MENSLRIRLASAGWWLAAVVFAARLLPVVVQQGMFFDGVTYAAISRNLAHGIGDTWHLVFAHGSVFNEHPPLAFVLESVFYRALGDHYWVEKLYSACTGLATAVVIAGIWRQLVGRQTIAARDAWLPVLLWMTIPAWAWIYENNMLENTVGMFAALGVYGALRGSDEPAGGLKWLVLAAVSTAAALFTKGPVGLFPLVTPLVVAVTLHRDAWKRCAGRNAIFLVLFLLAVGVVLLPAEARQAFGTYLHQQVFASVGGQREVSTSGWGRFTILWKMAGQLVVPLAVAGALVWIDRRRNLHWPVEAQPARENADEGAKRLRAASWFCLITGASASLPIMISPKQFAHYAFPSYAFFALALALWCHGAVNRLLASVPISSQSPQLLVRIRWGIAAASIGIVGISVWCTGRIHRDAKILHDSTVLSQALPVGSTVGFQKKIGEQDIALNANDFALQSYLARWHDVALDRQSVGNEYLLTPVEQRAPPAGFEAVPTELVGYRLYRRSRMDELAGRTHGELKR